jgi:hypothetical protein
MSEFEQDLSFFEIMVDALEFINGLSNEGPLF